MSRSVPKMCCKSRERRGPGAGVTDRPTDRYPPEERISADATTLSLLFFALVHRSFVRSTEYNMGCIGQWLAAAAVAAAAAAAGA